MFQIENLLNTVSKEEEVVAAKSLSKIFNTLLETTSANKPYSNTIPTHLQGGIALSSQHALDCLQDPLRTVRFIKGTYQAICNAFIRFPNEKIEILYAGCGPAAPIILPLLSMFKADQISVTLLDITETSLSSVSSLIKYLGVEGYFRDYVQADAIKYKHPDNFPLHIVVSETMDKGLTQEPQVRITQNLAPQLIEKGIFIPESIDIYTEHSFYSKEPYFDIYKNVLDLGPAIQTRDKRHLFSITPQIQKQPEFEFLSDIIGVPNNFKDNPDICIFAEVFIFNDQKLLKAESLISNPFCVASIYGLQESQYQLYYNTQNIPTWKYLEKHPQTN